MYGPLRGEVRRLGEAVARSAPATPADALRAAVAPWLDICVDPEVRQLLLLDAPSVLGWERCRDITQRYSLGMAEALLIEAMNAGQMARQPVRALAHILIGALDEAAMVIATAEDRDQARADVARSYGGFSTGCSSTPEQVGAVGRGAAIGDARDRRPPRRPRPPPPRRRPPRPRLRPLRHPGPRRATPTAATSA